MAVMARFALVVAVFAAASSVAADDRRAHVNYMLHCQGCHLPATEGKEEEYRDPPTSADGTKGKILVMDDEPMMRNLATKMLEHLGYEVETASDGREAITRYRQAQEAGAPFAAVLMDLTIPGGMGGKEAVGELLAVAPDARVIVSSGYSTDAVVADYRQFGFVGRAEKPYTLDQLSSVLQEVLGT